VTKSCIFSELDHDPDICCSRSVPGKGSPLILTVEGGRDGRESAVTVLRGTAFRGWAAGLAACSSPMFCLARSIPRPGSPPAAQESEYPEVGLRGTGSHGFSEHMAAARAQLHATAGDRKTALVKPLKAWFWELLVLRNTEIHSWLLQKQ